MSRSYRRPKASRPSLLRRRRRPRNLPKMPFTTPSLRGSGTTQMKQPKPLLGGAVLKDKWGTPDVIGVLKPRTGDFVPFPLEIIAVEIKTDPTQSITAFGQACAYRLFAHRVYLAMPETLSKADLDRLDSLCVLFGVGLIFFRLDLQEPAYRLAARAQRHAPDMFFANEFARRLQQSVPKTFHRLF